MKAIITGTSGTVGQGLRHYLETRGDEVIAWNRAETPIDDYARMETFVRHHRPDVLFHLAVASQTTGRENEGWWVTYHWTSELAWLCRQLGVQFVFTSSVMVFTDDAKGPFTPDSIPDQTSGYGYEKFQAEGRTFEQNPDAVVARLGWQINDIPGTNSMLSSLEEQQQTQGEVRASRKWFPACSFVADTAAALTALSHSAAGLYLVDSNTRWSFYEIVLALKAKYARDWTVVADDAFVYDQRMQDARVPIATLEQRLPTLEA